jgi:hypothetical protein
MSFKNYVALFSLQVAKPCAVTHGQSRLDADLEWSSGLRLIFQPLLIQREALAPYRLAQHARPVSTMPKLLT